MHYKKNLAQEILEISLDFDRDTIVNLKLTFSYFDKSAYW